MVAVALVAVAEASLRVAPPLPATAQWPDVEVNEKAVAVANRGRTDVVYSGSSIIDAAVDPLVVADEFPLASGSYNAGLEGADARSLIGWIRKVLVPNLRPTVVVLGLSPREVNDNGIHQKEFRDPFFGSRGWRFAAGEATVPDRVTRFAAGHLELVRERGSLRDPQKAIEFWRSGTAQGWTAPIDETTGRLLRHDVETPYIEHDAGGESQIYNDLRTDRSIAALRSGIEEVQRRGVTVVILQPSVVQADVDAAAGRVPAAAANRAIASLAADVCAPLIDLRDELPDRSYFDDDVHVRRRGAVAESTALGRELEALRRSGALTPGC